VPSNAARENILEMKNRIEQELHRRGQQTGEVKSGPGGIRDIEFVTQYLQLIYGAQHSHVRSFNTLDALTRLASYGFINAAEYRLLTTGYVFLRTIEHSLQLKHHKQIHALPEDVRELAFLARRLDYRDADHFQTHYNKYTEEIRAIFDKYIHGKASDNFPASGWLMFMSCKWPIPIVIVRSVVSGK